MPDREFPDRQRARAILETLAETSPATTAELATATESHPVTVERRCRTLQRAGYVRQCSSGVYALVESELESSASTDSTGPTPTDAAEHRTSSNPAD